MQDKQTHTAQSKIQAAYLEKTDNSIKSTIQLLCEQETRLAMYRGKEFLGLPQRTIPKLDELLLGLRKFMVLTAAPNIGKTALTIQLGLDVLKNNEDACLVYVSLEMSREDIVDRMRCNLTPMTYRKLYFGSTRDGEESRYSDAEEENLAVSKEVLEELAPRILILSSDCSPEINTEEIMQHVRELKESTGCKKAMVIIDYLQVFPVADKALKKIFSENEADRYRVSQMKALRKELNNDPLIVIAEARKPGSSNNNWAISIADILGSSRIAYGCDAGLLINAISDEELANGLGKDAKDAPNIREYLSTQGLSLLKLTIDKGRDGMQKGDILLTYHFLENRFEETTWYAIKNKHDAFLIQCRDAGTSQTKTKTNQKKTDWTDKL